MIGGQRLPSRSTSGGAFQASVGSFLRPWAREGGIAQRFRGLCLLEYAPPARRQGGTTISVSVTRPLKWLCSLLSRGPAVALARACRRRPSPRPSSCVLPSPLLIRSMFRLKAQPRPILFQQNRGSAQDSSRALAEASSCRDGVGSAPTRRLRLVGTPSAHPRSALEAAVRWLLDERQ